jgi:sugar (pentulose or hexulose) kinase
VISVLLRQLLADSNQFRYAIIKFNGMGGGIVAKGSYVVADFGKTLVKLTLWSKGGECIARVTRPNARKSESGYESLDLAGIADWLIATLTRFSLHPVEAIIPVSHGAAFVGLIDDRVAFPPLDYEHSIPQRTLDAYRAQRDPFTETGSPALPLGLNLGSQLHWLEEIHGDRLRGATLVPYAQYWTWFLSGIAVSEVTSLGCHTDLWAPAKADWSAMAKRRGWAGQFAPLSRAADAVGTLRRALAEETGLSPRTRILTGLHDSNAALVAARGFIEVDDGEATILSTGTWFVAMRLAGGDPDLSTLSADADCLVNVDAFGQPIPTARFMGGREIETQIEIDTRRVDIKPDQPALLEAVAGLVGDGAMMLPTFAPGFGPYPHGKGRWVRRPDGWISRRAATCLYAALVAERALSLTGTRGLVLVEGRFSEAQVFIRALASLRPDLKICVANAHNDVSYGALRLIDPDLRPASELAFVAPLDVDIASYAAIWREAAQ